ncbi:MAG: iron-containing alcohol dehydrogenase [Clostridiales bacterium]|nr:iron-containing alcohol dehydrogenase [Clostridiales bacterium]
MFESFNFFMPTEVFFGRGILKSKAKHMKKLGCRAFVVTGANSGRLSGALADCENALKELDIAYKVFEGIENNPSVEQCMELGKTAKAFSASFIIGIGGGSPLDAAKAIAVLAKNDISTDELFLGNYSNEVLPIVAIPTTSGTGSEVTPWSVLTLHDVQTKRGFGNKNTFPIISFVDPAYTDNLPKDVTINTALDAFTHCFESFISLKASTLTDALNIHALKLFGECKDALLNGDFDGIRDKLMLVSTMAGMGIAVTSTTIMHAMGYPLTYFYEIPHGAANALILPAYVNALEKHRPQRLLEALTALGMAKDELIEFATTLVPNNIKLSENEINIYSQQSATQGSCAKTGIPYEVSDISNMYRELFGG